MEPQRSHSFLLLAALALASAHAAQEKPSPELDAPGATPVQRSAHGASVVDGELWGAGADYKVRFRDGGFEFHPALGRSAPRNFPLAFELESIERGGVRVLVPAGAAPQLGADGVVRYAHGGGIEERYETRPDGVEQSFVFAEPLLGTGELVVRGRLATELGGPLGDHAELELLVPDLGGVRVGAVTGIDALGRTAAGRLRYDGATLELVLPGAFVDAAEYPLVLDPLIGSAFVIPGLGAKNQHRPDVAFASDSSVFLVVWQRDYSETDYDVHAQRVSSSGALVGGIIFVENAVGTLAANPTVASVKFPRRFLVAWQERSTGSYDIKALAVAAADASLSSTLVVASEVQDEIDPDACGERTTVASDALVVWERAGVGIYGARIAVPITGNPSLLSVSSVALGEKAFRPAIAKSFGSGGRALVVYNWLHSAGDVDVYSVLLDRHGAILAGPHAVATSIYSERNPDVDGDGNLWNVAYEFSTGGPGGDIYCNLVRVLLPGLTLDTAPPVKLTDGFFSHAAPAVAFTPGKTFVAWQRTSEFLFNDDIYVKGIDPYDCSVCEPAQAIDSSDTWDARPKLASQYSGGVEDDRVLATWQSGNLSLFGLSGSKIKAQLLEAFGQDGFATNLGGGCGAGGAISTMGAIAAGNPDFQVSLSGAGPSATLALLVIAAPGSVFACGGCSLTLPGMQLVAPASGGAASTALPIPCDTNLVGAQIDMQWVVFPTTSVPCPLIGNVSASNRVRLTIGQ